MKLASGWGLDGDTYPATIGGGSASFDEAVVGPHGFLSVLETQLGLTVPAVPKAIRVAQYLNRLKCLDDGDRFYSRSFSTDSWAVADYLLRLRDKLVINGWTPDSLQSGSRLATFADLERLPTELKPGLADRLRAVLNVLPLHKPLPIEEITAIDRSSLPKPWLTLFQLLEQKGIATTEQSYRSLAGANSDLAKARKQSSPGTRLLCRRRDAHAAAGG